MKPLLALSDSNLRWRPIPLFVWEWLEARLRVDEKVRKSVVFLGLNNEHGFLPLGTGLLGLAIYEDMGNIALITAKHVMNDIAGDDIAVRVNLKDGTTKIHKVAKSAGLTFKDQAIDLVIFPFGIDPLEHDIYMIPLTSSSWEYQTSEFGDPGPGDEVCIVGLYTTHYGHTQNIPVVRIGHIAAMPEEKVMTDRGYVTGYLIECHSIGGISGSPVYWNVPSLRIKDGAVQAAPAQVYVPIGIIIGYHLVESAADRIAVPQFQQKPDKRVYRDGEPSIDELRTGLSVVLPIQHVYDLFESEPLRTIMRDNVDHARKKSGYRPASAMPTVDVPSPPANDENPTHQEDFRRLVGAAARKPAPKD
jgi:hypothetical protein